jgi:predicted MFS family arabinose efflux permease
MTAILRATRTLTLSSYLSMLFLGVSSALVGAAARNIGLSPFQIGLMIAVQNVGFMLSVSISGALADSLEKPKILFAGCLILGFSLLAFYLTPIFWVNLLLMFLIGIGIGVYEGVTDAMLVDLHADRISRYINLNHFFVTFGSILIVIYLTYLQMGWRIAVVQSAVVVLILAVYFLVTHLAPRPSGENYMDRIKILVRERAVIVFFLVTIIVVGVESSSIGILTTYLMDIRGFTQVTSKIGLTVFLSGMAIGRIVVGMLARQDKIYQILVALFVLAVVFFSLMYFVGLGDLTLAAVFLAGLALSALLPMMLSLASLLYPTAAGTVMGTIKIAIPLGGIIVPFLMSVVSASGSFQVSLAILPAFLLLGLVLIVFSRAYLGAAEPSPGFEASPD